MDAGCRKTLERLIPVRKLHNRGFVRLSEVIMENSVIEAWRSNIAVIYFNSMFRTIRNQKINSPIEQMLFLALTSADSVFKFCRDNYISIEILPQFSIGKYRVDFLVKGDIDKLVVECDSQEWHERTEPQRRHEKERDRFIQSKGYKVFHFTGKEIMETPHLPALEIIQHATSMDLSESIKRLNPKGYK